MRAFVVHGLVLPRDWLRETSLTWPILCQVGRRTTTQAINQSQSTTTELVWTYGLADGLDVQRLQLLVDFPTTILKPALKVCRRKEPPAPTTMTIYVCKKSSHILKYRNFSHTHNCQPCYRQKRGTEGKTKVQRRCRQHCWGEVSSPIRMHWLPSARACGQ